MQHVHIASATVPTSWWKRENLWPGLALLGVTAVAWGYTLTRSGAMSGMQISDAMDTMGGMQEAGALVQPGDLILFLLAACRRERMKWGMSLTIRPTWSIFGAQNGVSDRIRTAGGEVNDILTITPTNC